MSLTAHKASVPNASQSRLYPRDRRAPHRTTRGSTDSRQVEQQDCAPIYLIEDGVLASTSGNSERPDSLAL